MNRLRRINIPIPNPGLAEWLNGSECYKAVHDITSQVLAIYQSTVPVRSSQLKDGADMHMGRGGWGDEQDRWFGWVTNNVEYAAVIEYGSRRRNIPGQRQLRRAAAIVAGDISAGAVSVPGVQHERRGRGSRLRGSGGRFVANPIARDKD